MENLAQAFTVPASQLGRYRDVILCDDIYTSGATIREAIAILATNNISVRGVIVIARPEFKK
jgi:predicted amidophosphoribosyltransferase